MWCLRALDGLSKEFKTIPAYLFGMLDDKFKTKMTFYYSLAGLVVSSTARLVCTCKATTQ